jgi:hypothetical protein
MPVRGFAVPVGTNLPRENGSMVITAFRLSFGPGALSGDVFVQMHQTSLAPVDRNRPGSAREAGAAIRQAAIRSACSTASARLSTTGTPAASSAALLCDPPV